MYQLSMYDQIDQPIATEKNYSTPAQEIIDCSPAPASVNKYTAVEIPSTNRILELPNVPPVNVCTVPLDLNGMPAKRRAPESTVHSTIARVAAVTQDQKAGILQRRQNDILKDERFDLAQVAKATSGHIGLTKSTHRTENTPGRADVASMSGQVA